MKVFSAQQFRHLGVDYPSGWINLPDDLAAELMRLWFVSDKDYPLIVNQSVKNVDSESDIPNEFEGVAQVGIQIITGEGTAKLKSGSFAGSIYSGTKSATTNGSLQVEAIPAGGEWLDALNNDATNSCYIGFGTSAAEAIANRDGGVAGANRFLMLAKTPLRQPLVGYAHYAWIGVGGTVSVQISIGV